jgi:hypothetical protein
MAIGKQGWEFLSIHPTISSCPHWLPSVQNSEKITKGLAQRKQGSPEAMWTRLQNAGTDFYCSSVPKLVKQWQSVSIIMGIMWKSDRISLVIENDICFCICTLVLMYYKHDHYLQYSPHRISKIVGLKKWRSVTLKNMLLIHPRGVEWIDNVRSHCQAGMVTKSVSEMGTRRGWKVARIMDIWGNQWPDNWNSSYFTHSKISALADIKPLIHEQNTQTIPGRKSTGPFSWELTKT